MKSWFIEKPWAGKGCAPLLLGITWLHFCSYHHFEDAPPWPSAPFGCDSDPSLASLHMVENHGSGSQIWLCISRGSHHWKLWIRFEEGHTHYLKISPDNSLALETAIQSLLLNILLLGRKQGRDSYQAHVSLRNTGSDKRKHVSVLQNFPESDHHQMFKILEAAYGYVVSQT